MNMWHTVCWSCVVEQAGLKLKGEHQKERRKKREKQQGGRWGGGAQGVHPCQGKERASNRQPQPCREGTVHHCLQIFAIIFVVDLCSLAWLFGPLFLLILLWHFSQVRRERISERMRVLQALVPGCDKVNFMNHQINCLLQLMHGTNFQRKIFVFWCRLLAKPSFWMRLSIMFSPCRTKLR